MGFISGRELLRALTFPYQSMSTLKEASVFGTSMDIKTNVSLDIIWDLFRESVMLMVK